MKKSLIVLLSMFFIALVTYSQVEPGTAESLGGGDGRSVTVNGLTQLDAFTGNYVLSADAAGGYPLSTFSINVNKPSAGATVHKAYLFSTPTWFYIPSVPNGCVTLAGTPVNWNGTAPNAAGTLNSYADVTSIVAPIINAAAAGISALTVVECDPSGIDGVALTVVFSDASASEKTILLMFGGLSTTGDNFSIALGTPIDPVAPGALLNMGLGIEFGYQGSAQYSIINVNGNRLTTAAGGADDAVDTPGDGNLITLGGIGDSNGNPADPFALPVNHYSDDELYSLLPLITNTTTNILVTTSNPSNNDNVFLAYFEISGSAIIGEGIVLSQTVNQETTGSNHTVKALIQDDNGDPVVAENVTFTVLSGPNAGVNGVVATDANGEAFFTYAGTGGVGFDVIQACFTNSLDETECSNTVTVEWIDGGPAVPVTDWALGLGILLIVAVAAFRFRRMI